jgi:CRP/FNR family transcriptional regulator
VASFLMRWVPGRGDYRCPGPRDGEDRTEFKLEMTRQEIADYLGLTIETVSRTLTKFKRRGIVAIDKLDEICVRDICTLCRMTGTHLTHGQQCSAREQPLIKDSWP